MARLQLLSDEFGLNLTCGTLSAACKYVAPSNAIDETKKKHEWSKLGFFASEQELISLVQDKTGTVGARNPITYLVEASDDIVYSTVDLEDAIKKRLLTWERLRESLVSSAGTNHHCNTAIQKAEQKIGDAVTGSMRGESLVQAFRTYAINEAVVSVLSEFKTRYDAIMNGEYHGQLVDDCSAAPLIATCKSVAREFVYKSKEILATELLGRKVISDLLSAFWEGARECDANSDHKRFPAKAYLLLSSNYRKVFEDSLLASSASSGTPVVYRRLQLVCDYIAGMTDSFACRLHKSLTNG